MSLKLTRVINGKNVEMNSSFMQGFAEAYLADIGRVICAWSHVEHTFLVLFLSVVVMKGASSDPMKNPEIIKMMSLSLDRQVRAFRERLQEIAVPKEHADKINNLLDRLVQLRNDRDEIAHSAFSIAIEETQVLENVALGLSKSWKNTKEYELKRVTAERLKTIFERMHVLFWDLVDLSLDQSTYAHLRPRS